MVKRNSTNNDLQISTQKTKHYTMLTQQIKTGVKLLGKGKQVLLHTKLKHQEYDTLCLQCYYGFNCDGIHFIMFHWITGKACNVQLDFP